MLVPDRQLLKQHKKVSLAVLLRVHWYLTTLLCRKMLVLKNVSDGILEGVSRLQALGSIVSQVRNKRPVDVVLFLSRLDEFRVDASDVQACNLLVIASHVPLSVRNKGLSTLSRQ